MHFNITSRCITCPFRSFRIKYHVFASNNAGKKCRIRGNRMIVPSLIARTTQWVTSKFLCTLFFTTAVTDDATVQFQQILHCVWHSHMQAWPCSYLKLFSPDTVALHLRLLSVAKRTDTTRAGDTHNFSKKQRQVIQCDWSTADVAADGATKSYEKGLKKLLQKHFLSKPSFAKTR